VAVIIKNKLIVQKTILIFILISCLLTVEAQWSSIVDYGISTDGAVAFVINDTAYVGGGVGSKSFYRYESEAEQWTQLSDIPSGYNRGWAFGFAINGKGYVCGGDKTGSFNLIKDVREYDPQTATWTQKADLPIAMDGAFACSVNGKAYIFGGFNGSYALNTVYEYDPLADTWTSKTDYPSGQAIFPNGFVIDGKIYVGLGSASGMAGSNSFYEYNPTSDIWTQKANFPGNARQATIAFKIGHTGYIGGGEENYSSMFYDFYKYNPYNNSWTVANSLSLASGSASAWCSSFVINNTAYYGLGASFAGGSLSYSKKWYKTSISLNVNTNISSEKIQLFPNPASEFLNIKISNDINFYSYQIIDSTGKILEKGSNKPNLIKISELEIGTYYLKLRTEKGEIVKKFIKQL